MYPSNQDYKLALMIGADSFRTLEDIEILPHPLYPTEPWFATGGLAIVFKIKYQGKLFALKCFTKESLERQERLLAISDYLKQNPNPYFVDFTYLENELWVENENGGEGYPVVLMEWVEGLTLDNYLKKVCANEDKPTLKRLYDNFGRLILWIQAQPIAHGDLKHDNILVMPSGQLKLIDYDGMYIPAFEGLKATELGSPCYQHPLRTADYFNENLDDFSLLILQTTLLAFETEPYLFFDHFNGDGLLFKDSHFQNFTNTHLKRKLSSLPNAILPLLSSTITKKLPEIKKIDLSHYLIFLEEDHNIRVNSKNLLKYLPSEKHLGFVQFFSQYYLFKNLEIIDEFKEKWEWVHLSANKNLPWSMDFIKKYEEKWNWYWFFSKVSLPLSVEFIENCKVDWGRLSEFDLTSFSTEFIEKNKEKWDWKRLSANTNLPWSINLIEKNKVKWDWKRLSENPNLPWSIDLIEKYKEKWDWDTLSRNENFSWTIEILEKFKMYWHWDLLSWNENLPWNEELIEFHIEYWEWHGLSRNTKIPWTIELIENHKGKWDWSFICFNENLPWTLELIEKYKEKWYWPYLSCQENLPWSITLIEKYLAKWDWLELSRNINLNWSIELIEKYKNNWNWSLLSDNENLPWSINLIEKYINKWDWFRLSCQKKLPWSFDLIEKYKENWDWERLSHHENLPWTIDLIEKNKEKLDWYFLSRNKNLPLSNNFVIKYAHLWDFSTLLKNHSFFKDMVLDIDEKKLVEFMNKYQKVS